jgi:hypothetical protein
VVVCVLTMRITGPRLLSAAVVVCLGATRALGQALTLPLRYKPRVSITESSSMMAEEVRGGLCYIHTHASCAHSRARPSWRDVMPVYLAAPLLKQIGPGVRTPRKDRPTP